MLTLYIVESGDPTADHKRLIKSFGEVVSSAIQAVRFNQIHSLKTIMPWYGVFWNNEIIDIQLMESLKIFLTNEIPFDVYTVMKKQIDKEAYFGHRVTQAPRFFRNHVQLSPDELMPWGKKECKEGLRFERILDGFILAQEDNDSNTI